MPASLLGLLAVATFYIVTVVFGLCANRCLALEEEDGNDEGEDHDKDDLDLLHLLESSLTRSDPLAADSTKPQPSLPPGVTGNSVHYTGVAGAPRNANNNVLDAVVRAGAIPPAITSRGCMVANSSTESAPVQLTAGALPAHNYDAALPHNNSCGHLPRRAASHDEIEMLDHVVGSRSDAERVWNDAAYMQRVPSSSDRVKARGASGTDASSTTSSSLPPPRLPAGGRYLLAERNIGAVLGSLSLLAVRVGGAVPASTAQQVYEHGLLWCQLPVAQSISVLLAGALFSRYLYAEGHATVIDPFQSVYGDKIGLLVMLPVVLAEMVFACVVISSMGALLHVTLELSPQFGVVCSITAILLYLVAGGLYAGTFTDAIQYLYLTFGMFILVPFVLSAPVSSSAALLVPVLQRQRQHLQQQQHAVFSSLQQYNRDHPSSGHSGGSGVVPPKWLGELTGQNSGLFIDQFAVLILGGIPMQSYFQRVLSSRTSRVARTITISASLGCLFNSVPAIIIGAVAIGAALGALGSGLLASGDSAIFGLATMLTHNIYRKLLFPRSKADRLVWVARLATIFMCGVTLLLCLGYQHWYRHWRLPYDILYTLVFPQFFCVVYYKFSNSYGSICGLIVGVILRVSFGEVSLNFPAVLPLPFYSHNTGQLFPYRTLAMFASLMTILAVSPVFDWLERLGVIRSTNDFCAFRRFPPPEKRKSIQEQRLERLAMRQMRNQIRVNTVSQQRTAIDRSAAAKKAGTPVRRTPDGGIGGAVGNHASQAVGSRLVRDSASRGGYDEDDDYAFYKQKEPVIEMMTAL